MSNEIKGTKDALDEALNGAYEAGHKAALKWLWAHFDTEKKFRGNPDRLFSYKEIKGRIEGYQSLREETLHS